MAAEAAEQRITQALQKELEKVDKECMRPLQVRPLSLYCDVAWGRGQSYTHLLILFNTVLLHALVSYPTHNIIIFPTCRFVLSAAVLVVLKIVPVLPKLLVSVCRGACSLW